MEQCWTCQQCITTRWYAVSVSAQLTLTITISPRRVTCCKLLQLLTACQQLCGGGTMQVCVVSPCGGAGRGGESRAGGVMSDTGAGQGSLGTSIARFPAGGRASVALFSRPNNRDCSYRHYSMTRQPSRCNEHTWPPAGLTCRENSGKTVVTCKCFI